MDGWIEEGPLEKNVNKGRKTSNKYIMYPLWPAMLDHYVVRVANIF